MAFLKDKKVIAVLAIAVLMILGGVGAWVAEGVTSTSDMGLSNAVPWGSSMALFVTFIGLATGCLIVAAVSVLAQWKSLEKTCGIAAGLGLGAGVGGVFYIMSDLGNFPNILGMLTGFNPVSLLSWDMIALPVFMVADIAFLLCLKLGKSLRGVAVFAIVASVFLLFVDAWIFAFLGAREAWNSSLTLPWFMVSACVSGLALTVLVAGILGNGFGHDKPVLTTFAALLAIDVFFAITELALGLYQGSGEGLAVAQSLLTGALAPWFWLEIVTAMAALACLGAAMSRPGKALPMVAGGLTLVAVLAKRMYFIGSGFLGAKMAHPSAEGIMSQLALQPDGGATLTSILLACGGVGILAMLFIIVRALAPAGR